MLWLIGLLAGCILGAFLYLFQQWTGVPVYILLMNVDYFPVLGEMDFPHLLEFSFHLFVSIVIVYFLYFILKKKNLEQKLIPYLLLNGAIGLIIFPTTMLSDKTPDLDNIWAWIIWFLGHIIYGFSIWAMLRIGKGLKKEKKL